MAVIGFFDSGIGGLTVMYEAMKRMPDETFLYYADTDHVPYGTRTSEEIYCFTCGALEFLLEQGAQLLVIACNTATSVAIARLREELPVPIVGMEPAIKPALIRYPEQKILVCATPKTIEGDKLHHLLEAEHVRPGKLDLLPLPELVKWAEKGVFEPEIIIPYLKERINGRDYSAVVLGCTHFTLFRDSFRHVLGNQIQFVDGTEGTVKRIHSILGEMPDSRKQKTKNPVRYFFSGRETDDTETIEYINNVYRRLASLDEYIKL